jgi:hypothetical protein
MTFLSAAPLVGGLAIPSILHLLHADEPGRVSYNAYNSGVATLTVASALEGVLEIAGTSSPYTLLLALVGMTFIIFAAASSAWHYVHERDHTHK